MANLRLLIFVGEFFGRLFPLILLLFWIPTLSTGDLVELSDSLAVYTMITSIGFWGGTSLANIDISGKIVQVQKLFIPFCIFVIFLVFLNDRMLEIISAYTFMAYTFFQTRYIAIDAPKIYARNDFIVFCIAMLVFLASFLSTEKVTIVRHAPIILSCILIIVLNCIMQRSNIVDLSFQNFSKNIFTYYKAGLGLSIGMLGQWLLFGGERLLISQLYSSKETAVYFLVSQYAMLFFVFLLAVSKYRRRELLIILGKKDYGLIRLYYKKILIFNFSLMVGSLLVFPALTKYFGCSYFFVILFLNAIIFSICFYNSIVYLHLNKLITYGFSIFFTGLCSIGVFSLQLPLNDAMTLFFLVLLIGVGLTTILLFRILNQMSS